MTSRPDSDLTACLHSSQVTQLKIDYNPYAKGFRQNSTDEKRQRGAATTTATTGGDSPQTKRYKDDKIFVIDLMMTKYGFGRRIAHASQSSKRPRSEADDSIDDEDSNKGQLSPLSESRSSSTSAVAKPLEDAGNGTMSLGAAVQFAFDWGERSEHAWVLPRRRWSPSKIVPLFDALPSVQNPSYPPSSCFCFDRGAH